ncbi:uncharacterized protein [Periplaneta americana]|uniref:uncharacterized protein n=1 Tax=Periplaneta americana TaxID=6978 RepID=UPI0037E81B92
MVTRFNVTACVLCLIVESVARNGVRISRVDSPQNYFITANETNTLRDSSSFVKRFEEDYSVSIATDEGKKIGDNPLLNTWNCSDMCGKTDDFANCRLDVTFITCVKLSLLEKVNAINELLKDFSGRNKSFTMLDGLLTLENVGTDDRNNIFEHSFKENGTSQQQKLDMLLTSGLSKLFRNRILKLNFIPGLSLHVAANNMDSGRIDVALSLDHDAGNQLIQGARKLNDFELEPWMLVPGAVMVGLFPYALLKLKMLVSTAMSFNNMVLIGAVLMTLRNLVFGTRPGGIITYNNLGYKPEPALPHYPGPRKPEQANVHHGEETVAVPSHLGVDPSYRGVDSHGSEAAPTHHGVISLSAAAASAHQGVNSLGSVAAPAYQVVESQGTATAQGHLLHASQVYGGVQSVTPVDFYHEPHSSGFTPSYYPPFRKQWLRYTRSAFHSNSVYSETTTQMYKSR